MRLWSHEHMRVGYDIHAWIYAQLLLNEKVATVVHIDGHKRSVYINFRTKEQEIYLGPVEVVDVA